MSYEPDREKKTEFMSAWNSVTQSLGKSPAYGSNVDYDMTLTLNTVGEGDASLDLSTSVLTPAESLYGYFIGDIRVDTNYYNTGVIYGDIFTIRFDQNDGATNSGGQVQRNNVRDDQCYAIASSAKLEVGNMLRISGFTIAPWVRVLGVLIEE